MTTTPIRAAAVVGVLLVMASPAPAGWRADCRTAARACRRSRGVTTTTVVRESGCPSQNCAGHCVMVNGKPYVDMFDALDGRCSLPMAPDCSVCAEYCSSTTTSTTAAITTTSTTAP